MERKELLLRLGLGLGLGNRDRVTSWNRSAAAISSISFRHFSFLAKRDSVKCSVVCSV